MTRKEILEKTIDFDDAIHRIVRLEEENAKLKSECRRCVYTDNPCIRSDFGVENDEDICPNYKNVFDAYTQLKEENAELKKKCQDRCDECWEEHIKLTKATELLRFWVNDFYDAFNNLNRYEERHKALEQSEQFLKENK